MFEKLLVVVNQPLDCSHNSMVYFATIISPQPAFSKVSLNFSVTPRTISDLWRNLRAKVDAYLNNQNNQQDPDDILDANNS